MNKSNPKKVKHFTESVPSEKIRSRKQQVVRDALIAAAEKLFRTRDFESVTVEEIAHAAGVSRRTFFRYFKSKEDVMVERSNQMDNKLIVELTARPPDEPPLLAIRNTLVPTIISNLEDPEYMRSTIRMLRETPSIRRALMERRNRIEERIAALLAQRLNTAADDNTPMLLAFLMRALHDAALNSWYDYETDDIAGLVDGLVNKLCDITAEYPRDSNAQNS